MANVSLKTDFKDGDVLFAPQLNLNFAAIQAALDTMNKIVWQDLPIDTVSAFRGTTEELNDREIIDGQLLYDTTTGETFIDYNGQRISTGSGNAIHIGENEPTNPSTQIWINPEAIDNNILYKTINGWKDIKVVASDTLPIGTIIPFGGVEAPTNWLICDGSAISRTTYADLFSSIGTYFGEGDGSTTFNLPDMRGKVAVGIDSNDEDFDTIGKEFGEKEHTLTIEEMPSHNHGFKGNGGFEDSNQLRTSGTAYSDAAAIQKGGNWSSNGELYINYTGGGQSHNIVQPSIVTNYIIKAFQSVGVVGNVVNSKSESTKDTYSCDYINGIIESGTNENGEYTKFSDGTLICTYKWEIGGTTTGGNQVGSLYYVSIDLRKNFPIPFISKPSVSFTAYEYRDDRGLTLWVCPKRNSVTENDFGNFNVLSANNTTMNLCIEYIAIGKWK